MKSIPKSEFFPTVVSTESRGAGRSAVTMKGYSDAVLVEQKTEVGQKARGG